ncbi:hypothetical protein ABDD95_00655 [Mucilaginibacter sp. PAMB04274]|uniref:hypothetical protein n=1 Tax=Mucilaginibacter sp. PAMB04274 TaxID=3138568 RepID=UPI0031F6057C
MKPRLKLNVIALLILLGCGAMPAWAQQKFKYKAALQKADSSRFYRIDLQPALTAKCQPGLADIRLTDEQGKPVPYLLGNALPVQVQSRYQELPQAVVVDQQDTLPVYIVHNKGGISIDRLWLKLRNTAVNRTVNLLGSDDLQHWFAIKENIPLQETISGTGGTFQELLTFPVSTYQYFKIQVNERKLAPVHVLQAGIYVARRTHPSFVPVPTTGFSTQNRSDSSIITLKFKDYYRIDKLHLQLAGARYYKRRIEIYQFNGKSRTWLKDTSISSTSNGEVYVSAKASALQVIIFNADNPPLVVKAVQVHQLKQSLVAYLEKEHQYQFLFGDEKAPVPQYDLQFFADSIGSGPLPVISHTAITQLPQHTPKVITNTIPVWLMWVAGGLALLALLVLTLKMTKEVSQKAK